MHSDRRCISIARPFKSVNVPTSDSVSKKINQQPNTAISIISHIPSLSSFTTFFLSNFLFTYHLQQPLPIWPLSMGIFWSPLLSPCCFQDINDVKPARPRCTDPLEPTYKAFASGASFRRGHEASIFRFPPKKNHRFSWSFVDVYIYIYVYILKRVRWVIIIVDDHPFCFCRCFPFWGKTWPALGSKQNPMIRTFRWPAGNDGPGTNSCNDLPSCDLCGGCTGITGTGSNGGG